MTAARKVRATVDFRPSNYSLSTGEVTEYKGTLVGRTGGKVIDQHTGKTNPEYRCAIRVIRPEWSGRGECLLITQGAHPGSRRYRSGTLTEVVEAAEKWAARRFYSEIGIVS